MADTFNYRIDHHGSLVRPAGLTERGDDPAALDDAVEEAVALQRRVRSTVVTDGDFPREDFRGAVLGAVSGFRRTGDTGPDGLSRWVAESLPKADGPLLADRAARLAELTVIAPKVSLPSPAYLAATTFDPALAGSGGPASARELGEALAEIIHAEIGLLVSRGIRLIQLNNPLLLGHIAADPATTGALTFEDTLAVEALAVRLDERPEGVRIGVCPGWRAPDAVDRARAERLYGDIPADRWILPYDRGRPPNSTCSGHCRRTGTRASGSWTRPRPSRRRSTRCWPASTPAPRSRTSRTWPSRRPAVSPTSRRDRSSAPRTSAANWSSWRLSPATAGATSSDPVTDAGREPRAASRPAVHSTSANVTARSVSSGRTTPTMNSVKWSAARCASKPARSVYRS